jgi:phosphoribosylamine--glycine ligase
MKILLVGGGGREHALAWKLTQSPQCKKLYCAPGNAGIAAHAECIAIAADDVEKLTAFAVEKKIDFAVIGPEAPLVAGLADRLREKNIATFGPSAAAARLEGSKAFMKDFCARRGIPTAAYGRFTDIADAAAFIRKNNTPVVIKADGLAAGKGVIIAQTHEEAITAATDMLSGASFGAAGAEVVIEEFLDGEELSFFAIADGKTYICLPSAQDHKRVGDGDTGPNTGGMGAYSPAHLMTPPLARKIESTIIKPAIDGMAAEGCPFEGVLFAGIMVVRGVPKLLEFNTRFGDPECETLMMRLDGDLLEILSACATGRLDDVKRDIKWHPETALCVIMAANGYPGKYEAGSVIGGLDEAVAAPDTNIFHAGTKRGAGGETLSAGGRVLAVTALGTSVAQAQKNAYAAVDKIKWPQGFCRRDIGWRAIETENQRTSQAASSGK